MRKIDFYRDAQVIIHDEYLDHYPLYDSDTREYFKVIKHGNRQDGFIERQIHGGMHVGRASLWVVVLHQIFKENFPDYVSEALKNIQQTLKIDEADVIDLIRLAVISHDSARLNEGRDLWDKQSAEKLRSKLREKGIEENILELFSQAAENKDNTNKFEKYFTSLGFSNSAQYLRKLIKLSDCIDIIRCCGRFELSRVLTELGDFSDSKIQKEKCTLSLIEFVRNTHRVIYLQGDMLFDCRIILSDGSELITDFQGDHFNIARKVQFEHAENVVSALANDMKQNTPYFQSYLSNEPLLCTDLATVKPQMDAFIHGTQSSMLPMLEKSGFTMESPLGLLRKQCTTLTGELYRSCNASEINVSPLPCFGKLHSWIGYGLGNVVDRYTKLDERELTPEACQQNAVKMFQKHLSAARKDGYNSIKAVQIYYLRAKYFGASDAQLIDPHALYREYKAAIDVYYLFLLITTHLELADYDHPTRRLIEGELIRQQYQFYHFVERILRLELDLRAIYENPSPENIQKLINIFPMPEGAETCVRILSVPRDCSGFESDPHFNRVTYMGCFATKMYEFIISGGNLSSSYYPAKEHIELMEQHLKNLDGAIHCKIDNIFDHPQHSEFVRKNFPIVFLSEESEVMTIHCGVSNKEYRAKRPLQFGEDIKMVATDTREHAVMLKKWLDHHQFSRVQVVLISELQRIQNTSARPQSIYQHSDGMARLSWFAANKVTPEQKASLVALKEAAVIRKQSANEAFQNARKSNAPTQERNTLAIIKRNEINSVNRLSTHLQMIVDAELYKSL